MDIESQWHHVEAERRQLGGLLPGLTPAQWDTGSLCTAWRVRDVAAHLAMTPAGAPSTSQIVTGLLRARGDLWAFGRDVAVAWGNARSTTEIVEVLVRCAGSRRMPVVTNAQNILLDVLVHAQDITVPLGLEHPVPADAGVAALLRIWRMRWPFHARSRLAGLTLSATDAELRLGDGPVVRGSLATLLLLTTGRTAAVRDRLQGPGAELLARR